jgi:nitrite reductase/ring-hydroxylating ferredoxin subunit
MKIKYFTVLFLSVLFFPYGCKDKNESRIPEVYVDFYININDPQFFDLQGVGNYVYVTGGVAGIIVYRKSEDEFVALDRCCSYNPDKRSKVEVDTVTNQKIICPCCKSEFSLDNGYVLKSPASAPLKQYQTEFDGENVHIFDNY